MCKINIFHVNRLFGSLSRGVGSKVFSTGSLDISGLNGDYSAIGVGNQTGVSVRVSSSVGGIRISSSGIGVSSRGIGVSSSGIGVSVSGEVLGLGSSDSRLINGDNSTVGVGNKSSVGISSGVSGVGIRGSGVNSVGIGQSSIGVSCVCYSTVSGKVSGTGSGNCGLISGDNSSVWVGDKLTSRDCNAGGENLGTKNVYHF